MTFHFSFYALLTFVCVSPTPHPGSQGQALGEGAPRALAALGSVCVCVFMGGRAALEAVTARQPWRREHTRTQGNASGLVSSSGCNPLARKRFYELYNLADCGHWGLECASRTTTKYH